MKTPNIYKENLKNKVITDDMLEACLYSVNKRAKNYRDKAREYRYFYKHNRFYYDSYDNVGKCEAKRDEYYQMKEDLLSVLKPICIHKEFLGYGKRRIYDYQQEYEKVNVEDIVWSNSYYDYMKDDYVCFVDVRTNEPIYHYYLFYETSSKSFHTPIEETDLGKYPNLEIIEIDELQTHGDDIHDLISCQFVKKIIELIKSKEYKYLQASG